MKRTAKITALAATVVLVTAGAVWSAPAVSNVVMTQIADTRRVEITYDLGGEDAIVTVSIETNGVVIPDSAVTWLTGDVCKVVGQGTGKSITWNAGADWLEKVTHSTKARVTAWCTNAPPPVMVIDLTGGAAAETYPVFYYANIEALPRNVTNTIYKSSRLVMRKIPRGPFSMGIGTGIKAVTLTQDFYAGVYEVTQGQWYNVMSNALPTKYTEVLSRAFHPMEQVSYDDIRGSTNNVPSVDWPTTGSWVSPTNFLGRLRAKTGIVDFDLPTEAQWEYACRAGTLTYYHDGITGTPNSTSNPQMDVLGRYKSNGGGTGGNAAIVGSYQPNTWGLYDMHGNVDEWCLDWYEATLAGGANPVGPVSSVEVKRVKRGGSWNSTSAQCFSMSRAQDDVNKRTTDMGFRLVRTLP